MQSQDDIASQRTRLLLELEAALQLSFRDIDLLNQSLTHSSFVFEHKEAQDYERLEFFGDAVLKFVVSEYLVIRYPLYDEGRLTEIRAVLINAATLEEVARHFDLEKYILVARGIPVKPSMLAKSMEAILGAIYLDRGMETARDFINKHFSCRAEAVDADRVKSNYKAQLQQLTQARAQGVPTYSVLNVDGPPHDPTFTVAVSVENKRIAQGSGRSKKTAEQAAAKFAFSQLDPEAQRALAQEPEEKLPEKPPRPA